MSPPHEYTANFLSNFRSTAWFKSAIPPHMDRRNFLTRTTRFSFGLSFVPIAGCATKQSKSERAATTTQRPSEGFQKIIAEFETQLPALMAEHNVPGLSIATIQDAKIAWRRAFGYKDAATKTAADNDTVFQAGSMSKPVFAYAALKLCEKGVLDLDTPLTKYTPDRFLTGDPRLDLITPRHILSHTSGFQNWRTPDEPLKIHFTPGSQHLYSGEGYYYLQSVITHLLGHNDPTDCAKFEAGLEICASDIDQFLIANVLAPFEMTSSGYAETTDIRRHLANGHDKNGNSFPKKKSTASARPAITRYASLGALLTTPTDYAKFILQILDPRPADNFHLRQKTIDEMLRPQTKVVYQNFTSSWGLGWQIQDNGLFNHGGDNDGFHCHAIASRQSKSGFIIMTNGDDGGALIQKLFASGILKRFFPLNA
jgi:CubicO group peptidase (beta-lactamase class C family)